MVVALLVALYYGSMIWGMFPEEYFHPVQGGSRVSWQSHLAGGILGSVLAWAYRKSYTEKKRFIWEYPNYYSEKDDALWQKYLAEHADLEDEIEQPKSGTIWNRLNDLED